MPYIGNTVQTQGFAPAVDYFSGNGVTVTFTLSRPVASVAQLTAVIDNVIQNPSSAFTVSGNSITFTSAPLSGTNNIWVEYTSLVTTYAAISQDPSVIGDITATGGYLATGDFGNSYIDGTIVDYVTGNARITTGPIDNMTFYHGGSASRSEMMKLSYAGSSYVVGNLGIGSITSPSATLHVYQAGTPTVAIQDANGALRFVTSSGTNYIQSGTSLSTSTAPIVFSGINAGTEYARLTTGGNLVLQGGTTSANGTGITFPATQSASSNANTLDDYEEGTWTITDASGAGLSIINSATPTYVKIGRLVFVTFYITYPSNSSGASATISLPFTAAPGIYAWFTGRQQSGGSNGFILQVQENTATAVFNTITNSATQLSNANLSGQYILMSGCYLASA